MSRECPPFSLQWCSGMDVHECAACGSLMELPSGPNSQ